MIFHGASREKQKMNSAIIRQYFAFCRLKSRIGLLNLKKIRIKENVQ
jgi:hypothetical protein